MRTASSSGPGRAVVGGVEGMGAEVWTVAEAVDDVAASGPVVGDRSTLPPAAVTGERARVPAGVIGAVGAEVGAVMTTGAAADPVPTSTGVVATTATAVMTDAVMSPPAMTSPRRASAASHFQWRTGFSRIR